MMGEKGRADSERLPGVSIKGNRLRWTPLRGHIPGAGKKSPPVEEPRTAFSMTWQSGAGFADLPQDTTSGRIARSPLALENVGGRSNGDVMDLLPAASDLRISTRPETGIERSEIAS